MGFTNSPSVVLIRPVLTEIQPFKNIKINKKCIASQTLCPMAIHFFVHFDNFKWLYLTYYWVYLSQTWGFCKAWSVLYDYVNQ